MFAVIDFETTGLSPFKHHRVVEVGVVLLDSNGNVTDTWETVINPERNVDAYDVHGLSAKQLVGAPIFSEIAGSLVELLKGRVLVSHNFSFDSMFLKSEMGKIGSNLTLDRNAGLCTMKLAGRYLPNSSRSLSSCCRSLGIVNLKAHSALDDAIAAAGLLSHYIKSTPGFSSEWADVCERSMAIEWPTINSKKAAIPRAEVESSSEIHFVQRLISRAPRSNLYPEANSYLDLLDRALVDRHLSAHEITDLISVAELLNLSKEDVESLHSDYFSGLAKIAYEDGYLSEEELSDLEKVAVALGIGEVDIELIAKTERESAYKPKLQNTLRITKGDSIVFTGGDGDREDLTYQAKSLGLRVAGGVSGKTNYLVASDPDSLSGKARKARELGVPIISYEQYASMINDINQ